MEYRWLLLGITFWIKKKSNLFLLTGKIVSPCVQSTDNANHYKDFYSLSRQEWEIVMDFCSLLIL